MQEYAVSHVTFQRGAGRRLQRIQNASTYISRSFVAKDVAIEEVSSLVDVGKTADVGPAALHAKVCNQS